MKSFKQHLSESEIDKRPVKFVIGDNITTLGQLMTRFPTLNEIIKELAIDDEWSSFEFNSVKALTVSEKALQGQFNKLGTIKECKTHVISAIAHFTSIDLDDMEDGTIEFIPESIHEWYLTLRVHSRLYVISTDETINEVEKWSATDHKAWHRVTDYTNKITHSIQSLVSNIDAHGREEAIKKVFSDINALIPFL